jgi:hypothetical protein
MQLQQEIDKVKNAQLAGYARGGTMVEKVQLNLTVLDALDAADILANNDGGECFVPPAQPQPAVFFLCLFPPPPLGGRGVCGGTRTE